MLKTLIPTMHHTLNKAYYPNAFYFTCLSPSWMLKPLQSTVSYTSLNGSFLQSLEMGWITWKQLTDLIWSSKWHSILFPLVLCSKKLWCRSTFPEKELPFSVPTITHALHLWWKLFAPFEVTIYPFMSTAIYAINLAILRILS